MCIQAQQVSFTVNFFDNTVPGPRKLFNGFFLGSSLIYIDAVMITVSLSKFINNSASFGVVYVAYYHSTKAGNVTNNLFSDNRATFEVIASPVCQPGLVLSLGSSRCIQRSENWCRDLIGIVLAAFIAGIVLVIFMLALNMTVAVGTLNGILFYAHIVAANAETYFLPSIFKTPSFITVFISWLNFDIGFDISFNVSYSVVDFVYKALIQLAFPAYVVVLVIAVIVASEYSSKFAKIIGNGNPVAVLATMILLSYAKLLNAVLASFSLFYWKPAYGSRNLDITILGNINRVIEETINTATFKTLAYILLIVIILILFLCLIYITLVFSWQWLLQYQDRAICKWMKYQKLHLFLEPYHAPYIGEYRFWTGLLLFVRAFLYIIVLLNSLLIHV